MVDLNEAVARVWIAQDTDASIQALDAGILYKKEDSSLEKEDSSVEKEDSSVETWLFAATRCRSGPRWLLIWLAAASKQGWAYSEAHRRPVWYRFGRGERSQDKSAF